MQIRFLKKPEILMWISGLLLWVLMVGPVLGQQIGSVAGDGSFGFAGDGGAATSASLADPVGVFVDSVGNMYVADTNNRRIRKVDTSGTMTTVAGNGNFGFAGDGGLATGASLADPTGIFVDAQNNLFIADTNNQRIRKVDAAGVITTIAGDGNAGFSGDGGPATSARLNFPTGVFVDAQGNVFFADRENHRIRKVDTLGVISTVAGNGAFGSSGDGGPATSASLAFPSGIFVNTSGAVFIADRFNYKVRKVDTLGVISTVAGNGAFGFSGDGGQATSANLAFPSAVYVDANGHILIADRDNHRIRSVDPSGVISTIAGNGLPTYGGDGGVATDANLNRPSGVWGNSKGAIWVADTNNRRIRKIAAPLYVSTPVQGLSGAESVQPGNEIVVLSVGITGDGTSTLSQVQLTLSDLSSATGLTGNDFVALRLYESVDAVLDVGDSQVASLGTVPIGSVATLTPSTPVTPVAESERFYLVSAVLSTQAIDKHAFRVGFNAGGITTSLGTFGQSITHSDVNRVSVDIVATRLVFTSQPLGSVSGQALTSQPVVVAQNDAGYVDRDFSEMVTLSLSQGGGQLSNFSVGAINGVATFSNVIYAAIVDGESVVVGANDEDGVGTNLPIVLANAFTSDVVATQLFFSTQPAGSVSGMALSTQPVVVARDGLGMVDIDFSDTVTLSESSAGSLTLGSVQAVNGVATFTNLTYTAAVDGESFTLVGDDEVGGAEGDLGSVQANAITSDILATRLVFTTPPSGSVSGAPFVVQPVLKALDDSGRVDTDFSETVTLGLSQGGGTLSMATVQAVNGVATYTQVLYTASSDRETFVVTANDEDGVGSDLPNISTGSILSNVLATRLVFATQPAGVASGVAFATQPVVVAQDSMGLVDTDFADLVTLTEDGPGSLSNVSVQAVDGVATFTNVVYQATADGESFTLTADDVVGGGEGDLGGVQSVLLTTNVLSTRLVFSTQPEGAISGLALGTQPVLMALDDSGQVDTSFAEVVTLSLVQGSGRLYNSSVQAMNGVVTFTNVIYVAAEDGELVAFGANDEDGLGSDLPVVVSNTLSSDVLATRLVFSTQPAGSVSGQLLQTQPVVTALNDSGQVDQQFADVITLSITSAGKLHHGSLQAVNGVATFTSVIYTALVDSEVFVLTADDVMGGPEGNLSAVQSNSITSDVLATHMVFTTQPAGAISGQPLTDQPIISALDDSGRVDTGFADMVALSSSVGSLTNNTAQAVDGVATFTNLTYAATLDRQTFTLSANDASGGSEGDLSVVVSNSLVADVLATKLIYLVEPSGSVSGQQLSTQPVVVAVDAHDLIDIDFTKMVTLSVDGAGSLLNASRSAVSGIATFTQVIYQTAGEPQPFRIVASADSLSNVFSPILSARVIAKQLVFAMQPAGSVSGKPLLVQPIVEARDSLGQIDRSFSETLTLTVNGPGGLSGQTAVADSGRAVFSNLVYVATADQEVFSFTVDDEVGGDEGDLPPTTSNTLMSDVVATQLIFMTQPSGSVSGMPLMVQPVVAAVDSLGKVDQGVAENVRLTTSIGVIENENATMQNGIATFVGLKYLAPADGTTFVLTADDQVGGLELAPVESVVLTSDVVASRLVFSVQPNGAVSGKPLLVQPELMAVDSLGIVDLHFSENVSLTTQSSGTLTNIVVLMANGVGKTTTLTFTATQDHQPVVLVANDAVGGIDLAIARSDSFECDVVASALMFQAQPQGTDNGKKLPGQPVVMAHVQGVVDVDFNDVISLTTDGDGNLQDASVQAVGGVATFTNVAYVAGQDREIVRLIANDTSNGIEGKLPQTVSSPFSTEVTATQLRFQIMPSGIISGRAFLTQPVVVAVDSLGVVDSDFEEQIVLTSDGGGQLANATFVSENGVAEFSLVSYTATSGLETFVIQADDAVGGRDLQPAFSEVLTAGAGAAHHLGIFRIGSSLVADGVSKQEIAVRVLDENNNPRLDDGNTRISLLVQGAAIGGGTQVVKEGEIKFEVVSKPKTGTVYLQVSAEELLGAVDSFQTVAGDAQKLKLVYDSTPLLANGTSTREVKLQLLDANDNVRKQDNSTLVALGVSGSFTNGGGAQAVKKGEAVFVVQAGTEPGLIHLRANAGGLPEVTSALIVGAIRPDLTVVKAPLGPEVISKNGTHIIQLAIQNTGLDTIRNAFDIALMLVGGADSIAVGRAVIAAPVAPDSVLNITVPFTVPSFSFATLASDYHWVAIVDAGGFVVEDNENNNISRGNGVAFPELSISHTMLDFKTVVPDSIYERQILVENRGRAELSVAISATDSQLTFGQFTHESLVLPPGGNRLLRVVMSPQILGPFEAQLLFESNDPKGGITVDVVARVAASNRVFLDLDVASGNQNVTVLETGRDKTVEVEVFLSNLPPLQAVSMDLEYNAELLEFQKDSWMLGGYFVGGVAVREEEILQNGAIRLSGGSVGNQGVSSDLPFGRFRFKTPTALPSNDAILEATVKAVQIRFLQENGVRDSLQIQSTASFVFKTKAIWPDLDGDGAVAFSDFLIFIAAFRQTETSPGWFVELPNKPFPFTPYRRFDIDGDGQVGFFDFVTYAQDFKNAQQ